MVKKLDILDFQVDNYNVHEAMQKVDLFLNNNEMNTIETVTTLLIEAAQQNETVKQCLHKADLAIVGESQVLNAAGELDLQRKKEIEQHLFFREFMKRIQRNHKTVFLLADTVEKLEHFRSYMEEYYERMQVVGAYALEECVGDYEHIVNLLNTENPDVILSVIPAPTQEEFLEEHRLKLNAKIWYGLGDHYRIDTGLNRILVNFAKKIRGFRLKRKVNEYNK